MGLGGSFLQAPSTPAVAILDPYNRLPGLDWRTRRAVKQLGAEFSRQTGLDLKIRSAVRTCAEQNADYAKGRSDGGPAIVTQARGCQSWHVFGRAIDADPVDPRTGKLLQPTFPNGGAYGIAGAIWERMGGLWGGRFSFQDYGHFEWHPDVARVSTVCPVPEQCSQIRIASLDPPLVGGSVKYAVIGFAVAGATLWWFRRKRLA